jgi:lipoprotein-releasing system permease protein
VSFEYFIAKRVLKREVEGNKVSRPIIRISILSIALAVVVNLITLAVVTGFQHEVRQKVSGFGSHALILQAGEGSIYESEPIRKNQAFLSELRKDKNIAQIHPVGYKPVLLQSNKTNAKQQQEIQGAVIKGVDESFDWTFFKSNLIEGKLPRVTGKESSFELLISSRVARDLHLSIGDNLRAFFVKNQPVKRIFQVAGIYETGLEEFDKKIVVGDLRVVQQLNDWGIQASITVSDTLSNGQLIIRGDVVGGNGNYRYDWGEGYSTYAGFTICPLKDTTIRLIVSDYWNRVSGKDENTSIADTAYLSIKIDGIAYSYCDVQKDENGDLKRTYLNTDGTKFSLQCSEKKLIFERTDGKGSFHNYIGGFELSISDWDKLPELVNSLKRKIEYMPTAHNEELTVSSIVDNQHDIFVWLEFLDLNVIIILVLMILIGVINMGSALLVLILVRTNFIGILKAMGANNWNIRKIFLYQASFLVGRGMILGNVVGIGICLIQQQFGILTLNPEVYYLSEVPIELNLWHWLFLNIGTLVVCVCALIIPSFVITRISPVKAIKFN